MRKCICLNLFQYCQFENETNSTRRHENEIVIKMVIFLLLLLTNFTDLNQFVSLDFYMFCSYMKSNQNFNVMIMLQDKPSQFNAI